MNVRKYSGRRTARERRSKMILRRSIMTLQGKSDEMKEFKVGDVWEQRNGESVEITEIRSSGYIVCDDDPDDMRKKDGSWATASAPHEYDLVRFIRRGGAQEPTKETESVMDIGNPLENLLGFVTESAKEGAKDGAATAATTKATQIIKKKLGKNYPAFFKTELGAIIESIGVPALLFLIAEMFPQLPHSEKVREVAGHALRGTTSKHTDAAIEALLPLFEQVGAAIDRAE